MKRTTRGLVDAGEPLTLEATAALRRYNEAKDAGEPAEQVKRLRVLAELAYQAVTDYQLYAYGLQPITKH
ncbi:hypothetical protein [Pseudomonas fulva]|uniref:hypothetical protein n=1 Tax=Pseudomonas fulva TaxID=47880 RepID=UPI0024816D8B|nr:hypothetical protein [Pseudomonas fulva]